MLLQGWEAKNTPERKTASTGDRTHNHQVMSPTLTPLSHLGGAIKCQSFCTITTTLPTTMLWPPAYLHVFFKKCKAKIDSRSYISYFMNSKVCFQTFNPLPDVPILGFSNSAANKDIMSKIWTEKDTITWFSRKHCGKRRNCSLRAISPFTTMFSKVFHCCVKMSIYGVKIYDEVVKELYNKRIEPKL